MKYKNDQTRDKIMSNIYGSKKVTYTQQREYTDVLFASNVLLWSVQDQLHFQGYIWWWLDEELAIGHLCFVIVNHSIESFDESQ